MPAGRSVGGRVRSGGVGVVFAEHPVVEAPRFLAKLAAETA
jgi:hypothetical protein